MKTTARSFGVLAFALAVASGACGGGSKTAGGSPIAVATFQAGAVVIGQPDFTTNAAPSAPGAATTDSPAGSAAYDGARLFLPDTYTNRVLGFSSVPKSNGASAAVVLGQAGLSTMTPGTSAATWYLPGSVHASDGTLAVADAGNHRVLLMPSSAETGAPATTVIGWPGAATPASGCAADRLQSPASAFIAGGKLLVADRGNNRVLLWNSVPTASGRGADLVLGQTSLTSCVRNDSLRNGTAGLRSASTLSGPTDVWTDGKQIIVADRGNNRVLVWNALPTANGAAADVVIGQTDFTLARDDARATVLKQPAAIARAGKQLFVADAGHNRVLVWSTLPTASGAPADFVLGQGSFTLAAANDDAQTGTAGSAPTARTMAYPSGIAIAGDALVVSDTLNRRFLVFRAH